MNNDVKEGNINQNIDKKARQSLAVITLESIVAIAAIVGFSNVLFPKIFSDLFGFELKRISGIESILLIYVFIFIIVIFLWAFSIVPVWRILQSFGEQPIAKSSYYALLIIPIIAHISTLKYQNSLITPLPINIKLTYFASLFIAIALIIYSIFSPKSLRNNSATNSVNNGISINNIESSSVRIEAKAENNLEITKEEDESKLAWRAICFYFYMIGVASAVIVLIRGALIVWNA